MKIFFCVAVALATWFLPAGLVLAATYYVSSTSGNNAYPGTLAQPWATLQKAATSITAGDTVWVQPGTYPERPTLSTVGTTDRPVVFQANGRVLTHGFNIYGQFISVNGFEITHDSREYTSGTGIDMRGMHNRAENNYIHDIYNEGIRINNSSSYCVAAMNRIDHVGCWGILLHGTHNAAIGNTISHTVQWDNLPGGTRDADGIRLFGQNNLIQGNYIHDLHYKDPNNQTYEDCDPACDPHVDGIQLFGATVANHIIENNLIVIPDEAVPLRHQQIMMINNGMNITIRNNIFIGPRYGLSVIRDDTDLTEIKIYNNTFINLADYGVNLNNVSSAWVKNNIFYNVGTSSNNPYLNVAGATSVEAGYNCDYRTLGTTPTTAYPGEQRQVHPRFADFPAGDYHLTAASGLLNKGFALPGLVDHDKDGVTRPQGAAWDIGAYEYSGPGSVPAAPTGLTAK